MDPLNKKLLRDLLHMKGQVIAIALVIAAGVGVLVMSLGNISTLQATTDAYYERYRFAEVFATVKRAPRRLVRQIADLPGVQTVEDRITRFATLDMPRFDEPVTGLLSSLPENGQPKLNLLAVQQGRLPDPARPAEVVVNGPFAEAHDLQIGSTFKATLNAQKRSLRVVGIALSPEHCYAIGPGMLMPDDLRYGILWMGRNALEGAFDLESAFNDITLALLPGTDPDDVIERLDLLLERYGGTGAYGRADQLSNWFLNNEMAQMATTASVLPTIFILVAAFLSNMVIDRLIATERGVIGLFKAFGYSNWEVGWHYLKMVLVIAGLGILLGSALGSGLGHMLSRIYADLFTFPFLVFQPDPSSFALGAGVTLLAAVGGAFSAVYRAVRLPPADAMRPPAPPTFRRSLISRSGLIAWVDQPTRMIFRHVFRWPLRSALTISGTALAVAVLILSLQWMDSINHLLEVHFIEAQRQDASVSLTDTRSDTVLNSFRRMDGVLAVEGQRAVPVRVRFGPREKRLSLIGVPAEPELSLLHDVQTGVFSPPPDGLAVATKLLELLEARLGDTLTIEVLEGRRPVVDMPVTATFETYIHYPVYVHQPVLNRLMRERPSVSTVHIKYDSLAEAELFRTMKDTPQVAFVNVRSAAIETFQETMAETLLVFTTMFTGFSLALGAGVTYNATRIALSERARELATLRVVGFTRFEISYILIGQSLFLTLLALPFGCVIGTLLSNWMTSAFDTELFRVPQVLEPDTYGSAMVVVLAASVFSALFVRRRLDHFDLVSVLKTRE